MASKMPLQKPGESKQDYGTPPEFIRAVEERFGKLDVDLAGREDNKKAPRVITPEEDSLSRLWAFEFGDLNCWLNPPFSNLHRWAERCAAFGCLAQRGRLFFLTPASVGSNWFADYVHRRAYVIALQGRITFEGETTPYPKDCILSVFGGGISGFEVWKWKKD